MTSAKENKPKFGGDNQDLTDAQRYQLRSIAYEITEPVTDDQIRTILQHKANGDRLGKAGTLLESRLALEAVKVALGPFAVSTNAFQSDSREFDRRLEENAKQIAASVAETHEREASMEYKLERMRNDSGIGSIRGASRMTDMQLIKILKEEQESDKRAAELSYQPW